MLAISSFSEKGCQPLLQSSRTFCTILFHASTCLLCCFFAWLTIFLNNSFIEIQLTYYEVRPFKVYFSVVCSILIELTLEHFHYLSKKPHVHQQSLPISLTLSPKPQKSLNLLSSTQICPFLIFHVNGVIQYVGFCDCHLHLHNVFKVYTYYSRYQYFLSIAD